MMKALWMCLFVLGTYVLFSSAFLFHGTSLDDHHGLLGPENPKDSNNNELQRRKPPAKVPGPKLTQEQTALFLFESDRGKKARKDLGFKLNEEFKGKFKPNLKEIEGN